MKKLTKKLMTSMVIATTTLTYFAPAATVAAFTDEQSSDSTVVQHIPAEEMNTHQIHSIENPEGVSTRSVVGSKVLIFLGSLAVGWIIDGTITYTTGHAPAEWVEIGLENVESYIRQQAANGAEKVVIPKSGPFTCPGTVIGHSGRCE